MSSVAVDSCEGEVTPSPEALRIARAAIARNRRRRLHLYGHVLELGWHVVRPGTVRATLPVSRRLYGEGGGLAVTPVATLADVAMGMALRSRRAVVGMRFPTVSLDIQHAEAPRSGRVTAVASVFALDGGTGLVRCEVTAPGGRPVAVATGTFLCRPLPEGAVAPDLGLRRDVGPRLLTRGPWDAGLAAEERQFVLDLDQALGRQRRAPDPFAAFLGVETLEAPEGEARLRMPFAATVANIAGHLQGGVVYGLAALACARAGGGRPLSVSVRFVRPGLPPQVEGRARVVHAGREVVAVQGDLVGADGRVVATAMASVQRKATP